MRRIKITKANVDAYTRSLEIAKEKKDRLIKHLSAKAKAITQKEK